MIIKDRFCTLKLFVNHLFTIQTRVKISNVGATIDKWKKRYALNRHNYEIYMYVESNFPHK